MQPFHIQNFIFRTVGKDTCVGRATIHDTLLTVQSYIKLHPSNPIAFSRLIRVEPCLEMHCKLAVMLLQ